MRTLKKYMMMSVFLLIYFVALTILIKSYYMYQNAYHILSRLISHSSIEVIYEEE